MKRSKTVSPWVFLLLKPRTWGNFTSIRRVTSENTSSKVMTSNGIFTGFRSMYFWVVGLHCMWLFYRDFHQGKSLLSPRFQIELLEIWEFTIGTILLFHVCVVSRTHFRMMSNEATYCNSYLTSTSHPCTAPQQRNFIDHSVSFLYVKKMTHIHQH